MRTVAGKPEIQVTDRDPRKKDYGSKNANYNTLAIGYSYASNVSGYEVYLYNAKGQKIKTIDTPYSLYRNARFKGVKTKDTVSVQIVPYLTIYYYVKAVGNYGGKKNVKSDIFYINNFRFTTKYIY